MIPLVLPRKMRLRLESSFIMGRFPSALPLQAAHLALLSPFRNRSLVLFDNCQTGQNNPGTMATQFTRNEQIHF